MTTNNNTSARNSEMLKGIDLISNFKSKLFDDDDDNNETIDLEQLVEKLRLINISFSVEDCAFILEKLYPDVDCNQISNDECREFYDYLDNRIALRLVFQIYAIPVMNYIEPAQLKNFFERQQREKKSIGDCERLISQISPDKPYLKLNDFYRLLDLEMFQLFNPIHKGHCQNQNKPLTHYFISTAGQICYPNQEQELKLLGKYQYLKSPNKEQIMLTKFRDLFSENYRCFTLKLVWDNEKNCFAISIPYQENNSSFNLNLDCFLVEMKQSAFLQSRFPVIIQFNCTDIPTKLNHLVETLSTNLEHLIYKKQSRQDKFPTLKSLKRQFLIYFFMEENMDKRININTMFPGEEETVLVEHDNFDKFIDIYNNSNKLPFESIIAIKSKEIINQIKEYASKLDNYWPEVTSKFLVSSYSIQPDNYHSTNNQMIVTELIRVGVQLMPDQNYHNSAHDACHRALFRLNGNCGYVLKPRYLRQGKLYGNEGPLKNEVRGGPLLFSINILCAQNLMIFNQNMDTSVKLQVYGHCEDFIEFTTRTCSSDGLVPFWNEQFRFNIRMADITFFYFEVRNNDQLIGYHAIPVNALLKGIRYVELYDREHKLIENKARLFLQIDYIQLADNWSPGPNDEYEIGGEDVDDSQINHK